MFSLDISDVLATEAEAIESLEVRQPIGMKNVLDLAAHEAVAQRGYVNRTGNLSESTFASEPVDGGDEVAIDLAAREEYASFVDKMGLMAIDEMADAATEELTRYFNAEAARLGR
jgi:hypothetical protein